MQGLRAGSWQPFGNPPLQLQVGLGHHHLLPHVFNSLYHCNSHRREALLVCPFCR